MTFASNLINVQSARLPFATHHSGHFKGQHILSVSQFSLDDLAYIFDVAEEFRLIVRRIGIMDLLKGHVLATLFYEPSTRTSSSFIAAIHRLGGTVIPISEVRYSSVSKGESLPDTIRTLESYADVIVLRHPEVGSAALAAKYARKPVINAGDGIGEHPTQALLDLFTILQERGSIDGLTVTMLGDLKYGRTVHSLAKLLSLFNVTIHYVSPGGLAMPPELVAQLREKGITQYEHRNLHDVLGQTDVLYVTRIQKERFSDPAEYERLAGSYAITPAIMGEAKPDMALMHPLPRVGEITMEVDDDPRAAYFRQMEYGLYVRMAILALVLGKA
ncbi:MAG TPA: aspartate carbamoyltransferase [Aggregatilineales bacterium]|nr:aspartate carbamoyltransferase [Anaerolineales bacterium]HRE46575.1 aspartate carbamoyltransferase [Aggregatilineales bacterium]